MEREIKKRNKEETNGLSRGCQTLQRTPVNTKIDLEQSPTKEIEKIDLEKRTIYMTPREQTY